MYKGQRLSVVMPAYNESPGIAQVVREYRMIPEVDEVLVVDNNSKDGTAACAREAGAVVVSESKQGYGHASKTALMSTSGDLILIVESDDTFRPSDIYKFLCYIEEFDIVFGTRTSKSLIWAEANMGAFLRYGNAAVAKLLEYLHNGPCLTDVGCTCKMFRKDAVQRIASNLTIGGSHFSPQLMLVAIRSGLQCVEIPVNYCGRVGASKITGSFWRAFRLGMRMIGMIIAARFQHFPKVETTPLGKSAKKKRAAVAA